MGAGKTGAAVEGTYVITYHARVQGGVHECSAPKRTVIVKPNSHAKAVRRLGGRGATIHASTHVPVVTHGGDAGPVAGSVLRAVPLLAFVSAFVIAVAMQV